MNEITYKNGLQSLVREPLKKPFFKLSSKPETTLKQALWFFCDIANETLDKWEKKKGRYFILQTLSKAERMPIYQALFFIWNALGLEDQREDFLAALLPSATKAIENELITPRSVLLQRTAKYENAMPTLLWTITAQEVDAWAKEEFDLDLPAYRAKLALKNRQQEERKNGQDTERLRKKLLELYPNFPKDNDGYELDNLQECYRAAVRACHPALERENPELFFSLVGRLRQNLNRKPLQNHSIRRNN